MVSNAPVIQTVLSQLEALGDPTRLRLLRLLERHELGVADLCDVLQMPQSSVSRHLKLLSDLGWLTNRRQGTNSFYRMGVDNLDTSARRLWQITRDRASAWPTFNQDQLRLRRRLRDHADHAQAFFAGAAGQWDKLRSQCYGESFAWQSMLALLPSRYVVADLGCGTGHLAAALAPHVRQVIGVDQSEAMLRAARKRLASESLQNRVDLRRGPLESCPIDRDTCDAALLVLVLTYVNQPQDVINDAVRILRSDGCLIVTDLLPHDREDFRREMGQQCLGFAADELRDMLEQAGLEDVTCRPIPPDPQAKGPALQLARGVKP